MPRPKKNPNEPKKIKLKEARIPMIKLLKDKEIREAAKALEDFRLKMKEEEILLGAKLTVKYDTWNREFSMVAERLETPDEVNDRLEKERAAAEEKRRREAERKAKEAKRLEQKKLEEQQKAMEMIYKLAKEAGLRPGDLVDRWQI